jgi:hypothetical protein
MLPIVIALLCRLFPNSLPNPVPSILPRCESNLASDVTFFKTFGVIPIFVLVALYPNRSSISSLKIGLISQRILIISRFRITHTRLRLYHG